MHLKFQFSLSSLLWFTLCLALFLSGILMYRRMADAERENMVLRALEDYENDDEPVYVQYSFPPTIKVDVLCRVTTIFLSNDCVDLSYKKEFIFRNIGSKEIILHFPLLHACFCTPKGSNLSNIINSEWGQTKNIVLRKGETYSISISNGGTNRFENRNFFGGKDSVKYGRWALVFGMPDGEDPDKYLVGTVLTNPVRWQIDESCKTF